MEYVVYLRKSRADLEAEAHGEGETLARHRQILDRVASQLRLTIDRVYEEIVSGETIAARPVMRRLLEEVEQGIWRGVLVMEVERLARGDTIDQGIVARAFQLSGTKIITPLKIYDPQNDMDEEYFEFGLFMSRREYKTINRRLQRGRVSSVREGKYVGSLAPYGYEREKLHSDKGFTLKPNPEQAEVVRSIFGWFTGGETNASQNLSEIARRLNTLKIPAAEGGQWLPSTVRALLQNPVYTGKLRWGFRPQKKTIQKGSISITRPQIPCEQWMVTDGLHIPIITEELFQKAQGLLHQKCKQNHTTRLKNPFAKVMVCALCGQSMTRRPQKQGTPFLICTTPHCKNVGVSMEAMEIVLQQALEYWFGGWRIPTYAGGNTNDKIATEERRAIQLRRQTLLRQKERIFMFLENGVYTPELFRVRLQSIECKLKDLPGDVAFQKVKNDTATERQEIQTVCELYRTLPDARSKNLLLRTLFQKIEYQKEQAGRWHISPSNFTLVLYPKLPPKQLDH